MSEKNCDDKTLDCQNSKRGVWLVKVPKYISSRWEKQSPMTEAGRIIINKNPGSKPEILFNLSDETINCEVSDASSSSSSSSLSNKIPREHKFSVSEIKEQDMAIFSQHNDNSSLSIEGTVVQKGECRPVGDNFYMSLKKEAIRNSSLPVKLVKQLEAPVINFKPISRHASDVENEHKKKSEGKKSRDDKEKVQNMIFTAFEKHQYYNIKDLERITRQPLPYLKEILKEICVYNAKNPHKNMWELKPEFRHYKEQKEES